MQNNCLGNIIHVEDARNEMPMAPRKQAITTEGKTAFRAMQVIGDTASAAHNYSQKKTFTNSIDI